MGASTSSRQDSLLELYDTLRSVHPEHAIHGNSLQQIYSSDAVRRILHWKLPNIDDVSDTLDLRRGQVFAVRMDALGEGTGLKQPVVAGLIARSLVRIRNGLTLQNKSGFIDGASVNTALAMAYYDQRLKTQSMIVAPRMSLEEVVQYVREKSGHTLRIVMDDDETNANLEAALTLRLIKELHSKEVKTKYIPLFHTKHGGEALQPFGKECADYISEKSDYIITSLGAGSTLQGMAVPIKNRYPEARIVIAEHCACPLVRMPPLDIDDDDIFGYETDWLKKVIPGRKTAMIGPHEQTINPFIPQEVLQQCFVARYSSTGWQQMLAHCKGQGLAVGPSSAANLCVARGIANAYDATVVTFTVEPLREYHLSHSTDTNS